MKTVWAVEWRFAEDPWRLDWEKGFAAIFTTREEARAYVGRNKWPSRRIVPFDRRDKKGKKR